MKTSDLTGVALDWAVEKCDFIQHSLESDFCLGVGYARCYSTDWAIGGPIIEREKIDIVCLPTKKGGFVWRTFYADGHTALVAAMRCYVASKMGDNVDIPKELT